jgi:2-aminoadipate transaminase
LADYIDNNLGEHVRYHRPKGGISLWLSLKSNYSANDICAQARKDGLIILPGSAFHPQGQDIPNIRISFSEEKSENLVKGMEILKEVLVEKNKEQRIFLNPLI